jgi:hypothetical protein
MTKGKDSSGERTVNKSAKTGRFVSDKTVKNNPNTTYKQTVTPPPKNPPKKGK